MKEDDFKVKSFKLEIPQDYKKSTSTNSAFKSKEETDNVLAMDQNNDLIDHNEEEYSDIESNS